MTETVTIKQLSQELGVSEQALRQWCKKNNVRKERTQGTKPSYIIDFDTEKQIKEYLQICDELGLSALVESHDEKEIKIALEKKKEVQNTKSTHIYILHF